MLSNDRCPHKDWRNCRQAVLHKSLGLARMAALLKSLEFVHAHFSFGDCLS